jgi:endonuclease/exonuclease/phosphatase family metal-dependent hydrolase
MPAGSIRRFIKWFFISFNIVICILFLIGCLARFINPDKAWFIGFLGLGLPYLIVLLIFSVLFWLFAKPMIVLISLITLLIGWKQISVLFAINRSHEFVLQKDNSTLRIVDWNVGSMYGLSNNSEIKKHDRTEIADLILKQQPDIICLQEFNHSYTQGPQADNIGLFSQAYPYNFFSKDYDKRNGFYLEGSIIFSKYPIIDSGKIKYPGHIAESLIYIDVKKNEDTVRVYTLHLQSFKFRDSDYAEIEKIKQQDTTLVSSKNVFQKMKIAFSRRGIQTETVKAAIAQSPYPSIVCGDFNDVPGSFTYFNIRGERQDAFLAKSFGIGRTFYTLAPTLRIDYILPDNHFSISQFNMIDEGLSDHLMLVADMNLKK